MNTDITLRPKKVHQQGAPTMNVCRGAKSVIWLLCLAGYLLLPALAIENTYINNMSQWVILATTTYDSGPSGFTNRVILPGGTDVDSYNCCPQVSVTVGVYGAANTNWFKGGRDNSFVGIDNPTNSRGVDWYQADSSTGKPSGGLLVTVFASGPNTQSTFQDAYGDQWAVGCDVNWAGSPHMSDCELAMIGLSKVTDCTLHSDNWTPFATSGTCSIGVSGKTGMSFSCSTLTSVAMDLLNTCLSGRVTGGHYTVSNYNNLGQAQLQVWVG